MSTIILTSPLRGWATSLDEVPDPVFAGRMLGDGVAIEPTGTRLHAPCDGEIISLHASRHAITIRTPEGAELLIHIGVDTVALGGTEFTTLIAEGDTVQRGDPLIEFNLDNLLSQAPAVITPILISNPDKFEISHRDIDRPVAVGERLMTLAPRIIAEAEILISGEERSRSIVVPMVHGIHARPSGRIAECARQFKSDIFIEKDGVRSNARSAVTMLALDVRFGDIIEVGARGEDAQDALDAVCTLIESGMGEGATVPAHVESGSKSGIKNAMPRLAPARDVGNQTMPADGRIAGVPAAPGLAIGKALWLRHRDQTIPDDADDPKTESNRLDAALKQALYSLAEPRDGNAHAIIEAHKALLQDPELHSSAMRMISQGRSAEYGWRHALREQADILRGSGNARLAERADDLLDVERQVIAILTGQEHNSLSFPPDTILLAEDLLPSDLIHIGPGGIAGFCTMRGGPTSHVAILAASMAIPGLVAAGSALASISDGSDVILDVEATTLHVQPSKEQLALVRSAIASKAAYRAAAIAQAAAPALTRDGIAVEVFANLSSLTDARLAVDNGAEGCGLLRTEFLFLDRPSAPTETEQAEQYQAIADALEGRPLIVRLLDIGGDKPAPYLPMEAEENPALGLRGIRVGLVHRDLLEAQLRAILSVKPLGQCRIMVPMVASVAELLSVREAVNAVRNELSITEIIELGVMIETPAAAVTADLIAVHADFLSIGSNDLTQYALAMDRGNPAVAGGIDAFHPAVLRMIKQSCEGANKHGRWTGVCGGIASDPLAAPILIGLGVKELSATIALVPEIKAAVRAVSLDACRKLAEEALALASAEDVRALARRFQKEQGA